MRRHDLVKLLVEKVTVGTDGGRAKVDITYRFGPPAQEISADGVQNSEEFLGRTAGAARESCLRVIPR